MNILIPNSWLKDYLKTQASPEKIAECLSLCGASVEQIKKVGKDKVYDIEVTTNRVDMMSVSGIAREVAAILPQFSIKAKFTNDPYGVSVRRVKCGTRKMLPLKVQIKDKKLCSRFTAVVIDSVAVKPSPTKIKKRLEAAGIRSLNNVIDISNYLMRSLGQPVHTFDYDKIKGHKMFLRQSKKGEKITTLDGKTHTLPGGDIVIEDGSGELIDLCGIMGGKNTAIDKNTKRVLLFIQTYNPVNIRKTSMSLAHRTEAAQLFEKNIDPELVIPAIKQGINLFEKLTSGKPASKLYDIYKNPYKSKTVKVSLQLIEAHLGTKLQLNKVKNILKALGFKITNHKSQITITIPSWRSHDVSIPEDIVEEVARIYGYHNLPSNLPKGKLPKQLNSQIFYWEKCVKHLLKYLDFTETYTYSLQSKSLLKNFRLAPEEHLKLKNPLTKEWVYLRTSILPSLLEVVQKNSHFEKINLFELAKVYLPKKKGLPYEIQHLSLVSNNGFLKTKGVVEQVAKELNIKLDFTPHQKITQLSPEKTAIIKAKSFGEKKSRWEMVGIIGEVFKPISKRFEIDKKLVAVDLNFDKLAALAEKFKKYQPIPKYPPIIEHLTFTNKKQVLASNILKTARKTHKLIKKVEIIDVYKNRLSLEITYQSRKKSLTDKEVGGIRKKIVQNLEKLGLNLRGKV